MSPAQRNRKQLRDVRIEHYPTAAAGSVMIHQGATRILCTASIERELPRWIPKDAMGKPVHGWVTAEYAMLPGSTPDRKRRGPDGRATEIQRLIGRALRAAVNLEAMPGVAITVDCDVIVADGGTRTAAITGGFVALARALRAATQQGLVTGDPIISEIAAISVGVVDGEPVLDLDYALDVRAEVDMNVVMNGKGRFIEVQGTGEHGTFDRAELDTLLDLASRGIEELIKLQREALG